jgi:hypothetical protein
MRILSIVFVQLAEIDTFLAKVGGVDVEALGLQHQLNGLSGGALSSSISKTRMPIRFLGPLGLEQ